jgi:hypothetical protein
LLNKLGVFNIYVKQYVIMNLNIFKEYDPSGKMTKESYIIKNHPDEYDFIIKYCESVNITSTFKEKVYLVINEYKELPICRNINCNNLVKFKNSSIGYLTYCSNKCISSDPDIKKQKENKSLERYGTKSPAQSKEVKDKIIKTNIERWGGNSPMSSDIIKSKSKKTLLNNWGVTNPSKSGDILKKRVESFKKSNYKENYKNKSLEKYGVDHPWMNKEIHKKTIEVFYKNYKDRIIEKISDSDLKFIRFEKDGVNNNLILNCGVCSEDFSILTYQFYYRLNGKNSICTKCFPISETSSIDQIELYNLIRENYNGVIVQNTKDVIKPYEIDIYLPELKLGFEFNGVFWHSDKFKDNNYHLKKYNKGVENDIKIITIWEDDWTLKREICVSFVLNKITSKLNKIMARKTLIKSVDYLTSKSFLDSNHLQGDCKSSIRLGLYNSDELVSIMTFSRLRMPLGGKNLEGVYELTRFCNKLNTTVTGGASKLLKKFIQDINPIEIQTYSDNLISNGDLYNDLGFKFSGVSNPGYWYVINGVRNHRFNWRKSKLVKMGYDKNKTEEEIMLEMGYFKIFNAGNKKWIYN